MDAKDLLHAMGDIKEEFIEEAHAGEPSAETVPAALTDTESAPESKVRRIRFRPWVVGGIAAALLLAFASFAMMTRLNTAPETAGMAESESGDYAVISDAEESEADGAVSDAEESEADGAVSDAEESEADSAVSDAEAYEADGAVSETTDSDKKKEEAEEIAPEAASESPMAAEAYEEEADMEQAAEAYEDEPDMEQAAEAYEQEWAADKADEGRGEGPVGNLQIANPFSEFVEPKEAEISAGFAFSVPSEAAGGTPDVYRVIPGKLYEIIFNGADGKEVLRLRKAPGDEDISGDYNTYENTRTEKVGGRELTMKGNGDLISVVTWTENGFSYALDMEDHPLSAEEVRTIVEETDAGK